MSLPLLLLLVALAAAATLFFTTLSYCVRDFSRATLEEILIRRDRLRYLEPLCDRRSDLVVATAVLRLGANVLILLGLLRILYNPAQRSLRLEYFLATLITLVITFLLSVCVPHALARYASAAIVAFFAPLLVVLNWLTYPIAQITHGVDGLVRSLADTQQEDARLVEQNIRSIVEEGQKDGLVDAKEREMIESVINLRNRHVGQIMTARPQIVAIEVESSMDQVKATLEKSGHSRIPVYEKSLDHIVGVLYARDLLRRLGLSAEHFDLRAVLRPAIYVPETKRVQDLLQDFRHQKVHIGIVLDEYGSTSGLITIEDILELLVGDIRDEYTPGEAPLLKRLDERNYEANARISITDINRMLWLNLPQDGGYDTLGGFLSTTMGCIPANGAALEQEGVKYTVLDAEPQKINRVRIELPLLPSAPGNPAPDPAPDAAPSTQPNS